MAGLRPWMSRTHPNFFIAYSATTIAHAWFGLLCLLEPQLFQSPAMKGINSLATPEVWGVGALIVAALLFQGWWNPSFTLAHCGLAIALAGCLTRFILILGTDQTAGIAPAWFLITAIHLAQTLEPPHNPATGR